MGLLKNDTTHTSSGSVSGFNAILDRGSEFDGKLTFEGTVRIDGKFKGEIISDAKLVVGETGKIEAFVNVDTLSVSGEIVGDIKAKSKVHIHSTAVVRGNIETPSLIIEEGAIFQGSCNMEKAANSFSAKTTSKPFVSPISSAQL